MAVRFDASGEVVYRSTSLPASTNFSVCGWFSRSGSGGDLWETVCGLTDGSALLVLYGADYNAGSGTPSLDTTSSSTSTFGSVTANNTPYAWAITCSGTGAGTFIGYVRAANSSTWSSTSLAGLSFTPNRLDLGYNNRYSSETLNGRIWNVKAWDRVLTANELLVETVYRRPMFPSSLHAWWPLVAHTDLADYSGAGRGLSSSGTISTESDLWKPWKPGARIYSLAAGGGGSTYNEDVSEAGSATDSMDRIAMLAAAASEAASATDSVARTIVAIVAASESATAVDTPAAAVTTDTAASESTTASDAVDWGAAVYDKDQADSATAADQASSTATMGAAQSEPATATDAPASTVIALAEVNETASGSDVVASGAASYTVEIVEAATAADAASAIVSAIAALSEALSAAESVTVNLVMGAAASEAASATDATNWGGAVYSVSASESATLGDAVASALEALAAMQESASAGETFTAILTAGAALLEAATASEIATSAWQTTALLTETAVAADTVAESAGGVMSASISEAASASDTITVQYIAGFVAITVAPQRRLTAGAVRTANLNAGDRPANRPGRGR